MSDTIVWISGATSGIGAALARSVPYPGARVINLSRSKHPELESVELELDDRASWKRVADHFSQELKKFRGRRAIFIQNAVTTHEVGLMEKVDSTVYADSLVANAVAPIALGADFLRAAPRNIEVGLVMMSAGGAVQPAPGHSAYCAAKAGIEQWVRVVRLELRSQPNPPWIVAIRPGVVDTPMARNVAALDPAIYPQKEQALKWLAAANSADFIGQQIWAALPPAAPVAVLWCTAKGPRRFKDDGAEITG